MNFTRRNRIFRRKLVSALPVWWVVSLLILERCNGKIAPSLGQSIVRNTAVGVGIRSALQSQRQQRRWGLTSRSVTPTSNTHQPSEISALEADALLRESLELEPQGVRPAFATRTPLQDEVEELRHVSFAYERGQVGEPDELAYLESIVPCAVRTSGAPASRAPVSPPSPSPAALAQHSTVSRVASSQQRTSSHSRGGAAAAAATLAAVRPLLFWENMVCGAISRSVAQTVMHPANTMKTMLQSSAEAPSFVSLLGPQNFKRLTRGAGANFLLSVPHGAVNFGVLEFVRSRLQRAAVPILGDRVERVGPGLDFLSSAISTICCSVISTPQMMITDNIMAGNYNDLPSAITGLYTRSGIRGFYAGWWPGLVGKIPSYALTWTFFQEFKKIRRSLTQREATDVENSIMGCLASAATVTIMIPMDTVKTRLVTQASGHGASAVPYKGIIDCATRVLKEEGVVALYRGLPPRLLSVVPMIGIQFGVYEFMKKTMLERSSANPSGEVDRFRKEGVLSEAAMEVAASPEQPFPAPHFLEKVNLLQGKDKKQRRKAH